MIIGIVGSEAAKFTAETEKKAKMIIRDLLTKQGVVTGMSSGHCHLGGVDIWAEEIANELGLKTFIYPPKEHNWINGYRPRNLLIASTSGVVICITVKQLPPGYVGMRFGSCYHCQKHPQGCKQQHVKSGGCWTALRCKERMWFVI